MLSDRLQDRDFKPRSQFIQVRLRVLSHTLLPLQLTISFVHLEVWYARCFTRIYSVWSLANNTRHAVGLLAAAVACSKGDLAMPFKGLAPLMLVLTVGGPALAEAKPEQWPW